MIPVQNLEESQRLPELEEIFKFWQILLNIVRRLMLGLYSGIGQKR